MLGIEFLITSLVVVLLPGPGMLFTISTGLMSSKRASVFAALGCTAGIVPHLLASVLGLAAILHASSVAFQIIKYLGVAYLAYLAWVMWKESGAIDFHHESRDKKVSKVAVRAFLTNILNPKLSIFFLAFLPQFVPHNAESSIAYMLLLSAVFMLMTLAVFIAYGVCANGVRTYLLNSPGVIKWIQRTFSGVFVALGAKLAMAER
ncbi:hypothetical protein L861_01335 [Litchfieldella anticariensis FP35 = DSM 16096]|uniref:Lysine transporter LysE n=1 Tax=Litchfieldella anticariensis (strain DSM 16096 / CECT 5854 / CIP 108499 / LMG 22089 / FP35) TaxID=1121939 RepID=S2KTU5_LITA3|nr:LysE family translocator [Halomonas anticariensis]EPC03973.1 hypothetical protein L861_01335 [Halomonas anticariensis FP35 = DSM 16096]